MYTSHKMYMYTSHENKTNRMFIVGITAVQPEPRSPSVSNTALCQSGGKGRGCFALLSAVV